MKKEVSRVADIMSPNVLVAELNRPFTQLWRLFFELQIHHLPVVDENQNLVGILSTNDILKKLAFRLTSIGEVTEKALNENFTIFDLMTPDPICIDQNSSIKDAAKLFTERHISALPVMNEGEIVGIITSRDLIKHLAKEPKKALSVGTLTIF